MKCPEPGHSRAESLKDWTAWQPEPWLIPELSVSVHFENAARISAWNTRTYMSAIISQALFGNRSENSPESKVVRFVRVICKQAQQASARWLQLDYSNVCFPTCARVKEAFSVGIELPAPEMSVRLLLQHTSQSSITKCLFRDVCASIRIQKEQVHL